MCLSKARNACNISRQRNLNFPVQVDTIPSARFEVGARRRRTTAENEFDHLSLQTHIAISLRLDHLLGLPLDLPPTTKC